MKKGPFTLILSLTLSAITTLTTCSAYKAESSHITNNLTQTSDMPVEQSFNFQKNDSTQSTSRTPPPSAAPISMLELKYIGYFDVLPTPIDSSDKNIYPFNIIGRMVGHSRGTGVTFSHPRMILTAGHLFVDLRSGHQYFEKPVWYGQVNTQDPLPNVQAVMGRKVILHDYGLGYGLVHFKKSSNFMTQSERLDIALVLLYEDGAHGYFAPIIEPETAFNLLASEQQKLNVGYISVNETFGYAIDGDGELPWLMRKGKISQQQFERSPWPYNYLAIMKTKTEDLKRIHRHHPTIVIGPGMSGSVIWVKDNHNHWQAAGIFVASTSKENVEKYLKYESKSPIITVVYVPDEAFEKGPFNEAQLTLNNTQYSNK